MAKKYRKKPVMIEAIQFDGLNVFEIAKFMGREPKYDTRLGWETIEIETLEGTMKASRGDYIIKGVKGEFYPCKSDIFEATYEEVEEREVENGSL